MRAGRYVALLSMLILASAPAAASDKEFDSLWHDGNAELSGYRLKVSRYGQERDGTAVLVYVKEPFSESKHVKVDDRDKNPDDTFDALKVNIIRDFQTGLYDYNTMVSVFARATDFSPAKVTFTSAEWCGHVYEELVFHSDRIKGFYSSYFENESGPRDIAAVDNAISEDNLFILLRGLRGDYLKPGQKKKVAMLPSVYWGRLSHKPLDWVTAEIQREKKMKTIKVPAGRFETRVYAIKTSDGRKGKFYIEERYPHRIVRWEMLPDVSADLTGSERLAYWKLNQNGDERYLKKLGL
jgi:hypothetical protein